MFSFLPLLIVTLFLAYQSMFYIDSSGTLLELNPVVYKEMTDRGMFILVSAPVLFNESLSDWEALAKTFNGTTVFAGVWRSEESPVHWCQTSNGGKCGVSHIVRTTGNREVQDQLRKVIPEIY